MSIIGSNVLAGASGGAADTGYRIQRSLRFNSGDTPELTRTPGSAGNTSKFTISFWAKRSKLGSYQMIVQTGNNYGNLFRVYWDLNDQFRFHQYAGSYVMAYLTSARYRDPSAWYHYVISIDTTLATAANRARLYVNGVEVTEWVTETNPAQNLTTGWNATIVQRIGREYTTTYGNYYNYDGYLAEFYNIDGQALAPTDFGEFDDNNVWQPKAFSGTYGTNGFHLDFSDASSNAALGTDSSGNSNTWTVNNLSAHPGNAATYANAVTTTEGGGAFYSGTGANLFSASTLLYGGYNSSTYDSNIIWTPPGGIEVTNPKITLSYYSAVKINGTTYTPTGSGELTIPFSGTLNTLVLENTDGTGNVVRAYGLKPDGTNLVTTVSGVDCDSLVDTPTNYGDDTGAGGEVRGNYCVINRLGQSTNTPTISNGNLQMVHGSSQAARLGTIGASSGKYYWEIVYTAATAFDGMVGVADQSHSLNSYVGATSGSWGYYYNGRSYHAASSLTYGSSYSTNDVISIALDMDNLAIYFAKNGVWQNSGDPTSGSSKTGAAYTNLSGTIFPAINAYGGTQVANWGQRPFAYAAPSGYKALCTQNLPEPTIADGSAYFDTKLYTGNGSTQTISGLGFSPDLLWYKTRNGAFHHGLQDSVRGVGKTLSSSVTLSEYTETTGLTAFTADGFSLNGTGYYYINSNNSMVAWAWDAGANSSKTYAVTVVSDSGNKYRFDGHGTSAVTLDLEEGSTYTFDQSDSSNAGHPLRFSTTSNGTHGGGSEYTTGVVTNGTPGSAGAYTKITIATSAPTLYYYCTQHSGMGGQINTNSTAGATVLSGSLNSSLYNQSTTWSSNTTSGSTYSSYSWTGAFNGTITGSPQPSNTVIQASGGFAQIQFSQFSSISSVKVVYYGGTGGQIYINYGESSQQLHAATTAGDLGNGVQASHTFTASELTNLRITNTGSANFPYLYAIYVDGKLLVDSSVSITTPSINSVVRANPAAGFSIVSVTADADADGDTVGHGLNAKPEMIIEKNRSATSPWYVHHSGLGDMSGSYLRLNATNAKATDNTWNVSEPTSSVISIDPGYLQANTDADVIYYCFAPVEGYSAFGSYTGNGSADGSFVYTGFRPRWVMIKRTDATGGWNIIDTARSPINVVDTYLYANQSWQENYYGAVTCFDILSNGIKFRSSTTAELNANGGTYIYAAFAENPFKTARAR